MGDKVINDKDRMEIGFVSYLREDKEVVVDFTLPAAKGLGIRKKMDDIPKLKDKKPRSFRKNEIEWGNERLLKDFADVIMRTFKEIFYSGNLYILSTKHRISLVEDSFLVIEPNVLVGRE